MHSILETTKIARGQPMQSLGPPGDAKPSFSILERSGANDHGCIWRTRSLDQADSKSSNEDIGDENLQLGEPSAATALHSSFDATLLENSHVCGSLFDDDDKHSPERSSSFEDGDPNLGDLSGRKHLRQHAATEAAETVQPGTVRKKLARTAVNEMNQKTPGRPRLRPPNSAMKKPLESSTPTSAVKRRRPQMPLRKSPMSRAPPTTPFLNLSSSSLTPVPARHNNENVGFVGAAVSSNNLKSPHSHAHTPTRTGPGGVFPSTVKSMSRWHNTCTTAASTLLETTIESDSVDTSSPTTTRFRFTSFPASLPRVNNPRIRQCPDSVRKRMSFGETIGQSDANQCRDDDGTQNTSISSLSADAGQHVASSGPAEPPSILEWRSRHGTGSDDLEEGDGQLGMEDNYFGYSDDDSTESPVRQMVGRTRLNFNMVMSPPTHLEKQKTPGDALIPLDLNMDLIRPYDQRRINSYPSSLSSNTQMNNISGYDEAGTTLTPARSGERVQPGTPHEVQLHFQLETAQCSPIPGSPGEQVGGALANLTSNESLGVVVEGMTSRLGMPGSKGANTSMECKSREDTSMASESTGGKARRLRPMPDISAFESVAVSSRGERSVDDSGTLDSKGLQSSPRLLCPPTPVRTPAWANEGGVHPFFGGRQNSLIATKVLLACPSQVLERRCSLESSVLDDDSKASVRAMKSQKAEPDSAETGHSHSRQQGVSFWNTDIAALAAGSDHSSKPGGHIVKTPQMRLPPHALPKLSSSTGEVGSVVSFSNDFETLARLGRGAFADVYKVRSKSDNRLYAVKRNRRQFRGKRDRDVALAEVRSMQRLQNVCAETGKCNSSDNEKKSYSLYLLFFYRAWQEDGYFLCQTELCCRDTCREMIDSLRFEWNSAKAKYPSLTRNLPVTKTESSNDVGTAFRLVPNETIWKICHDISAGLSHIHSHGLVHHDIKPSNIFFVTHVRFGAMCKIGDFGMAGDIGSTGDGQEGDTKYMPPELLSSGARHPSSDIFSLGLTLYELATDRQLEMPSEGPRWHELRSDHTPDLPACREKELIELIKSMTSHDDKKRPTADAVLRNERVISAGHGCDVFLRDYIKDIEDFDRLEEERLAEDHQDQTPRNLANRSGNRSPSLGVIMPIEPNLFSPSA